MSALDDVERIERAALRHDGVVYDLLPPARHHNVIWMMRDRGLPVTACSPSKQGFTTSTGRFVDRKEGAAIAIAAGQIAALQWPPDLYSEDLW